MIKHTILMALISLSSILSSQENSNNLRATKDISISEPVAIDLDVPCDDSRTKSFTRKVWYPGKTGSEAQACAEAYIDSTENSTELEEAMEPLFDCAKCDDENRCDKSVDIIEMKITEVGSAGGEPFRKIKVKYEAICAKCPEDKKPIRSRSQEASFFPNPTSNYLNINLAVTSKSNKVNLRLVDLSGRVIINVTDNIQDGVLYSGIDVSSLASGMYVLQASTDGKVIHTEKIQVTK